MVKVSSEDAMLLLSKWNAESSRLSLAFIGGGEFPSSNNLFVFIKDVGIFKFSDDTLSLSGPNGFNFVVSLREALFAFSDGRDTPYFIDVDFFFAIVLPNLDKLFLWEPSSGQQMD